MTYAAAAVQPHPLILEVIVQTVEDAVAAADGGADRLEVVRDLDHDGLTPSSDLVRAIAERVRLPLRVMLRENAGFTTDRHEIARLRAAAAAFAELGVDGFVIGFEEGGTARLEDVAAALEGAPGVRATFHRAFDRLRDPLTAIDQIATLPAIDSILTGGGDGSPSERCARLREYNERAGGRLRIIAGGGVDDAMFATLARERCVGEVHVGRLAREGAIRTAAVSIDRVRCLRDSLDVSSKAE
jgi:copper homeostasis protein